MTTSQEQIQTQKNDNFYQPTNFCDELFKGKNEEDQNRHYQTCMFAYN